MPGGNGLGITGSAARYLQGGLRRFGLPYVVVSAANVATAQAAAACEIAGPPSCASEIRCRGWAIASARNAPGPAVTSTAGGFGRRAATRATALRISSA